MALGWLWWRAWFPFVAVDAAAVCVAGMAFGSICRVKRNGDENKKMKRNKK